MSTLFLINDAEQAERALNASHTLISANDSIVLMNDACYALIKTESTRPFFYFAEDLSLRGIQTELSAQANAITASTLVELSLVAKHCIHL